MALLPAAPHLHGHPAPPNAGRRQGGGYETMTTFSATGAIGAMSELKIDDRAPDFELVGQDGNTYRLRDYRGQPVVLVFYPLDFHPVSGDEHALLVEAMVQLNRLEAQVLGISIDSRYAHAAFAKQLGIPYPLLADFHPRGMVGRLYGVYQEDKGFNGRWIFVVDPEGRISFIQRNEISEVPELEDVIEAVKESL